jgi:large conductance mechanosensitive channel
MFDEFKKFIMRGNVVDLAVAIVIGTAFKSVIDQLVGSMLTPLIGMIASKDFAALDFTINGSTFTYGLLINAIIQFVLIAAAIFFLVVKPLNVINERRQRGQVDLDEQPAPTDEALLLAEIRDLLAARA